MRLLISPILILGLAIAGDGPQSSDSQAERLVAMRAIADGITVRENRLAGARRKLERLAEPVYRFDDPARQYSDGTVWAWGRSGRPAALLTLSKDRAPARAYTVDRRADVAGPWPDLRHCPGDRQVAAIRPRVSSCRSFPRPRSRREDATKRLRQMKELMRQIKAYEFFSSQSNRAPRTASATSFGSSRSRFTVTRTRIPG